MTVQTIRYLVCRNGKRISVKRADRNNDFGEVLCERSTHAEAMSSALYFRMGKDKDTESEQDLFRDIEEMK